MNYPHLEAYERYSDEMECSAELTPDRGQRHLDSHDMYMDGLEAEQGDEALAARAREWETERAELQDFFRAWPKVWMGMPPEEQARLVAEYNLTEPPVVDAAVDMPGAAHPGCEPTVTTEPVCSFAGPGVVPPEPYDWPVVAAHEMAVHNPWGLPVGMQERYVPGVHEAYAADLSWDIAAAHHSMLIHQGSFYGPLQHFTVPRCGVPPGTDPYMVAGA